MRSSFGRAIALIAMGVSFVIGSATAQVTEITITGCGGFYQDGRCVEHPTPEQRKKYEEDQRRDREAREAEAREQAKRAAEFKTKVDAQVKRMGEARRAEAERFVRMQEDAAAARAKLANRVPAAKCNESKVDAGYTGVPSTSQAQAKADVDRWAAAHCGRDGVVCGASSCQGINLEADPRRPKHVSYTCGIGAKKPYRSCGPSSVGGQ